MEHAFSVENIDYVASAKPVVDISGRTQPNTFQCSVRRTSHPRAPLMFTTTMSTEFVLPASTPETLLRELERLVRNGLMVSAPTLH